MTGQDTELARLTAYVFGTLGRRRIGEDEWVRLLALERKWMPPSEARALAQSARAGGLLRNAGERDFEMGLEAEGLVLPLDYRPDAAALQKSLQVGSAASRAPDASEPLFRRLVRATAQQLGQPETEIVRGINAVQQAMGDLLSAEVAGLYYAALHGVNAAPFYDEVGATLRRGGRNP